MGTEPKRPVVIISRTDRIGDLLLSFPAFHRVREVFPHARIVVLVRKYTRDLLFKQDFIDRVVCVDELPLAELVKALQQEKPDWFLALYTDSLIGYLARRCGAKFRIGPLSKGHSWFTYNRGVWQKRSRGQKNEAEYNLDLVNRMSPKAPVYNPYTQLFYGEEHRRLALSALPVDLPRTDYRLVVINPFGGGSAKNISLDEYRKLGDMIASEVPGARILYLARDKGEVELIMRGKSVAQSTFMNQGSILFLVALLDQADLYIGPSTGPTHIAAFLHKPVVAIYPKIRNQAPRRWGVLGTEHISYVQPEVACPQKYGCRSNCRHFDCFSTIRADELARVCKAYLQ